ncbi:MAG TPA: hypothetical protein VD902_15900 [Symbiobacteriaceae bacterium]|nr:hypothetical protein [Symbiobacteriaceae bacterium]
MFMRLFAVMIAVAFFAGGCGGTAVTPPKPGGLDTSTVADGIRIRASVASSVLDLSGQPAVDVTVTNESQATVSFLKFNGCDNGVHVTLEDTSGAVGSFRREVPPVVCTQALAMATLAPGGTIRDRYVWAPAGDVPAPAAGEYRIVVRYQRADSMESVRPIAAEMKVAIQGSR